MTRPRNPLRSALRVLQGGRDPAARLGPVLVVVSGPDRPPFPVEALVLEEDTFLVLSAEPTVVDPPEEPMRLMTRLIETLPETPGSVLVRERDPVRMLAVVHDVNQDPSWREAWVHRALEGALQEAEPEGFVRLFVDEGPPMARLLYAAADEAIVPGYVGSLLAAFPVEAPDEALLSPAERDPNLALVEPLTPRELEVLAVVATGATNQEVARDLTISVNTVNNILAKLEVDNRREAARRGRSLGLVD